MTTFSRLSKSQQADWWERSRKVQERYGITHNDFIVLCDAQHILHTWNEHECNGQIQRNEPTDRWPLGRPRWFNETEQGELIDCGYVPDRAMGAMKRVKAVLACHHRSGLSVYWQDDPRGCAIWLYRFSDALERGAPIDSCYASIATPCYY
jgi:hypothetical protein